MDDNDYEDAVSHKAAHADFLEKLRPLKVPLDEATVNYAKNW